MSAFGGPNIITDGLVLNLDAGNIKSYPESGTTWFDKSGYGNNGTLINGPTFNTGSLGSIVFDGVDDYVVTPLTTTYSKFTLNTWFYNTTSSKISRALISKNSYYALTTNDWPCVLSLDQSGSYVSITITSGTSFYISDGPSAGSQISGSLPSLNTWYNATATYDQVNLNLYVNGILVTTTPNTISLPNNTGRTWTIGSAAFERSGGVNQSQYNGNIASTQIYNRALTSQEVLQNYNATKTRFNLT